MSRSSNQRRQKKASVATKDPEVPSPRPSNDESDAGHVNGTVVELAKRSNGRDIQDEKQTTARKDDEQPSEPTRKDTCATSVVDVSQDDASEKTVTGPWSLIGMWSSRGMKLIGSADRHQRRAGYFILTTLIITMLVVSGMIITGVTVVGVYAGKTALAGTTAVVVATTGARVFLQHQRKKAEESNKKAKKSKKDA